MKSIELKNVRKTYKTYKKPVYRVIDALFNTKNYEEYHALKDISLDINQGEAVGVLGKNGAGKSTLLKVLTGVTTPTSGSVSVKGKIAAILELNSGFDEELTGKENILLKGTMLGYSKEDIKSKMGEIIAFADIGKHIEQPVRTYSSGMKSRLGFAIAVNVDPDVLIIDEALSVGDDIFKTKCLAKMTEFRKAGKTIFFVSHSLFTIKSFCTKCAWIRDGELVEYGETGNVVALYENFLKEEKAKSKKEQRANIDKNKDVVVKDYIEAKSFSFKNKDGAFDFGDDVMFSFKYEVKKKMEGLKWSLTIRDAELKEVYATDKMGDSYLIENSIGKHNLTISLTNLKLLPGKYYLSGELRDGAGLIYTGYSNKRLFEISGFKDEYKGSGIVYIDHKIIENK